MHACKHAVRVRVSTYVHMCERVHIHVFPSFPTRHPAMMEPQHAQSAAVVANVDADAHANVDGDVDVDMDIDDMLRSV